MLRPFLLFFAMILSAMAGERKYHQPLGMLKAEEVKEMRITALGLRQKPGKSRTIANQEFIRKLLALVTPRDYPQLGEDDLNMSMPGLLLKVEFIGKEDRALASIQMLGAWNLMCTKGPGMSKPVTGSNRPLCEQLMKQFEEFDPEAYKEAATRYHEHLSGKDPRELHEVLEKR